MDIRDLFFRVSRPPIMPPENLPPSPDFISKQVHDSEYFFADLKPDFRKDFALVCGGLEHCDDDYFIKREKFDFYAIEYILSGTCEVTLDGRTVHLQAGSIFGYGPSTAHSIRNTNPLGLSKYFVNFTGSLAETIFSDAFTSRWQPRQIASMRTMNALFRQLIECGNRGGEHVQRIGRLVTQLIATEAMANAVDFDEFQTQSHSTFLRCRAVLEANFKQIDSVAELAEVSNVSSGYLSRIFKQFSSESPYDAIIRLKLNYAADALIRKNGLIKEVAEDVGFEDPYHFSRIFRQFFGLSPKHFRERLHRNSFKSS